MFERRRAEAGERVLGLMGTYKNVIYKVSHPFDDYVHVTGYGRLFGIPHSAYVVLNENVQVEQRKAEVGDYIISHDSKKGGTVTEINESESYLLFKESSGCSWRVYHSGYSVLTEEKSLEDTAYELGTKAKDNINPNHYKVGGIETIDYLKAKLTEEEYRGYLKGNIIKYVSRAEFKNGAEDYKKAKWYADRLATETK